MNLRFLDQITNILYLLGFEGKDKSKIPVSGGGKWVSSNQQRWQVGLAWVPPAWVLGSKIKMGLALAIVTATWHRRRQQRHGVGEWVFDSLYRLSISHFPFFLSFFLRFLLSSFGFGMLRAEGVFFFFFLKIILFKIYMGHGLLGWLDDG